MFCPHSDILSLVSSLQGKRVLIVGDVMLDAYCFGETDRISPEAPVPIVHVSGERYVLGGAGNVARNVAALGGIPTLIGRVGQDNEAKQFMGLMEQEHICSGIVAPSQRRTTMKTRILARGQQLLRLDYEDASPFSSEEISAIFDSIEKHLPEHDVLVLSDYAKGLMSEQFMNGLLERTKDMPKLRILVDPKPSNVKLYKGITLLTPNARETSECAGMPARTPQEIMEAASEIMRITNAPSILTTLGADGMALFEDGKAWHIPTVAQKVFDVTGAGDTVIATLALALAAGGKTLPSCVLANYAAGIVVASVGAATASPQQICEAVKTLPQPDISCWI